MKLLEIRNVKTYKASQQSNATLLDDARILASWYTTLKTKGEFKYSESDIDFLAHDIIKELVKRNIEFHPENWKDYPKELFLKTFSLLKSEGLKMPANIEPLLKEALEFVASEWDAEAIGKFDNNALLEKLVAIGKIFKTRGNNPQDEEIVNAYIILSDELKKRKLGFAVIPELEELAQKLEEGIRPAFGSPGGKKYLAKTICSYIPEHKIYVEPFIGGGAVLFMKKPSEKEIINDMDMDLIETYKFFKTCDLASKEKFKNLNWKLDKDTWLSVKNSKPVDLIETAHRFLYVRAGSFGKAETSFSPSQQENGRIIRVKDRIDKIQERTKNIIIKNEDFRNVLKEYDSKETFFYLDPPYPSGWHGKNFGKLTNKDLLEAVEKLQGKWILSLKNLVEVRNMFSKYNLLEVETQRVLNPFSIHKDSELLISNFPLQATSGWLAESYTDLFEGDYDDFVLDTKQEIDKIGNIILVPDYISWTGSTMYAKNRLPNDLDIVIRDDKFPEEFNLKLNRLFNKIGLVHIDTHLTPRGPNSRYFPLYNLALVPVINADFVEVGKEEQGFADELYEQVAMKFIPETLPEGILMELEIEKENPPLDFKEDITEGKKELDDYPENFAVMVSHFRGASAHLDFRRKQDGHLEGETIFNLPEGLITEPVDTIEKGKKWNEALLKQGKFRPDMNPQDKVVMVAKSKHPLVWLNVREVSYEPGSVGATRYEPGVFITMDEGMAYPGVQRPYFKEFFLDMKHFKGRMVERLIGVDPEWEQKPKGPAQWQTWTNLEDQVPYILSKRQRKDKRDYIPQDGEKAIPPEWEKEIKPEFQWWKSGLSPKERMNRLDSAFNDLISKEKIKATPIEIQESAKGRFALRWHWWMGQKVVREMPATDSRFELLIDSGKNALDRWDFSGEFYGDPIKQDAVSATRKSMNIQTPNGEPFRNWLSWEGAIPAKDSKLHKTKTKGKVRERENSWAVGLPMENTIIANPTFANFEPGQEVWIDQHKNIFTGEHGGTAYGNQNSMIPAYIEIKDSGDVEIIEESDLFVSFKFGGSELNGYWTMRREDPKSDIWIFSKGKLPAEKIKESLYTSVTTNPDTVSIDSLNVTLEDFPLEIKYGGREYLLIKTKNEKLLMNKK